MSEPAQLLVDHLDIWTGAIERKSSVGRGRKKNGGNSKISLYGVDKLRSLILDLAVRGKLGPQDPADGDAGELLKRLLSRRSALIDLGLIRKSQPIQRFGGKPPFVVPRNWEWVRLDQVGAVVGGGTPPASDHTNFAEPGDGIPWLTPADLGGYRDLYISRGARDLTDKGLATGSAKLMPEDTVLFTSRAPIGYVAIASNPISTNQGFKSIVPFDPQCSQYIALAMRTFADEINANAPGTTFKEVSGKIVGAISFPLPPLAEQMRIVAKVDELMALVDSLEAGTRAGMEAHETLVRELLATLANSQDANDLSQNWSRIDAHFDALFTTEQSIDALKQAIVELAVSGRLVAPNINDTPVDGLIERIARKRTADLQSGTIRKQKHLPPFERNQFPGTVPAHWAIQQLDQLAHVHSGITKGRNLRGKATIQVPYLRVANVQRGYLDLSEIKDIAILEEERGKYELIDGDLLVTEGGDWDKVGRTCIWRSELEYSAHQNHVFKVRKVLPEQSQEWMELFLNSAVARDYFAGASKQTTNLASINKTELRGCPIPVPPEQERDRILERCALLIRLCDELLHSIVQQKLIKSELADLTVTSIEQNN